MGNSHSSSSDDSGSEPPKGASTSDAKHNTRLRDKSRQKKDHKKDKKSSKNKTHRDPNLHPTAHRVVRPFDSQIIYNHGRIGVYGVKPESHNFPCMCRDLYKQRQASREEILSSPLHAVAISKQITNTIDNQYILDNSLNINSIHNNSSDQQNFEEKKNDQTIMNRVHSNLNVNINNDNTLIDDNTDLVSPPPVASSSVLVSPTTATGTTASIDQQGIPTNAVPLTYCDQSIHVITIPQKQQQRTSPTTASSPGGKEHVDKMSLYRDNNTTDDSIHIDTNSMNIISSTSDHPPPSQHQQQQQHVTAILDNNSNNIAGTAVPVLPSLDISTTLRPLEIQVDPNTGYCIRCGGAVSQQLLASIQAANAGTTIQQANALSGGEGVGGIAPSTGAAAPGTQGSFTIDPNGGSLGSLLNSMVLAQRHFTDSLRQVQSEDQPLAMLSRITSFDMPTLRALEKIFHKISDQDGEDNLISAQELCKATGISPESLLGKALFRLLDIGKQNNINFRAWVLMLAKLSPNASLDDKITFAFNLYDYNGDGYIDYYDLITILRGAIPDLTDTDASMLVASIFEMSDLDGDRRININDYRTVACLSQDFYQSFTIDVPQVLRHYNIISQDEIAHRMDKLRERDQLQDERLLVVSDKERAWMEKDDEMVRVVDDLDALDLE